MCHRSGNEAGGEPWKRGSSPGPGINDYGSSYCHWRIKVHAKISRIFRLLAKLQPPSHRSGAMARREGGRAGAVQDASRISGIVVSRAAFWSAAALRRFSTEPSQTVPMLTKSADMAVHFVIGAQNFVRKFRGRFICLQSARGLAQSKTLRVFWASA